MRGDNECLVTVLIEVQHVCRRHREGPVASKERSWGMSEGKESFFVTLFMVYYTFCIDWTLSLKKFDRLEWLSSMSGTCKLEA